MIQPVRPWKFTIDQYHAMERAGILTEDDRTELIGGEILAMAAKRDDHVECLTLLNRWFNRHVGDLAAISVQDPVILSDDTEPEPDLALIRLVNGQKRRRGKPYAGDILLIIEVADT